MFLVPNTFEYKKKSNHKSEGDIIYKSVFSCFQITNKGLAAMLFVASKVMQGQSHDQAHIKLPDVLPGNSSSVRGHSQSVSYRVFYLHNQNRNKYLVHHFILFCNLTS